MGVSVAFIHWFCFQSVSFNEYSFCISQLWGGYEPDVCQSERSVFRIVSSEYISCFFIDSRQSEGRNVDTELRYKSGFMLLRFAFYPRLRKAWYGIALYIARSGNLHVKANSSRECERYWLFVVVCFSLSVHQYSCVRGTQGVCCCR